MTLNKGTVLFDKPHDSRELRVTLPPLHANQRAVAESDARFIVLTCGRRWGKTRLGALLCIKTALAGKRAWWVAPTYKVAQVGWRTIRNVATQIPYTIIRDGTQTITTATGGVVQVRSADNIDSLRGEGLDFVVIDECAFCAEEAWTEALRPALADRKGRALFISTPRGRNWYWRLDAFAQSGENQQWGHFHFTSYDNPTIDPSEIDAAKETLPERVFRQEFMAEFIEDGAGVFRYVREAIRPLPQVGHDVNFVAGVDFGRTKDYTVVTVIETHTRAVHHVDRFTGIDWLPQIDRIAAVCERYRPSVVLAEQNAAGSPVISVMRKRGLPVVGFQTDHASKTQIVDNLAIAFERRNITLPNYEPLILELEAFEAVTNSRGITLYGAPTGMHDDTVISLALAWHAAGGAARRPRVREY